MNWLKLQPNTLSAVLFSLRTTIASLVALAIAFWMEMGSPQWAAMTVWIVAQNSRGMSLSKGRWRIAGTLLGMVGGISLIAVAPQHPWIFFVLLAGWVGWCTGMACMLENFRGYAMVLAGYTGAIIAVGASEHPDQVFYIAMARGSYILLGVVCEMVAGMVTVPGADRVARTDLQQRMAALLSQTAAALALILRQDEKGVAEMTRILGSLQGFNDQLEFIRIDSRHAGEEADQAYVTLERVSFVLARGVGVRSRLASAPHIPARLAAGLERVAGELDGIAALLRQDTAHVMAGLGQLETMLQENHDELERCLSRDDEDALQQGIVGVGVEIMLIDFRSAVESHYAGLRKLPALKRHRIKRQADGRLATINAIRAAVAILIGAFVWEVTAWSYGGAYMSLLSVVCARFAIMNNMILISKYFFYGAVCSVLASIIPVFLVMPITSDYAVFAIPVAVLMFLGGLALRIPALAGVAASYVNFFPWVLTLDNQARVDEVTWFNQSLALLLALWSGVQVFRTVLPFSVTQAWAQLRRQLVKEIQKLKEPLRGRAQTQRLWTNETTLRMEQIIRFAGQIPQDEVDSMIRGTLAVMTVGRNLLTLRDLVALGRLPPSALAAGEHMVRDIIHLTEQGQESSPMTVEEFTQEQAHLETVFHGSRGLSRRRDLAAGIGCLRIIRFEYQTSRTFFLRGYGAAAGQVLGAG
ncbi:MULTISPECIES: FUSC family protein [Acetobacteraceae]|uniref:FUSC family protein n=2 Tax=Acetobacteraceae TaxID=433 RepID=A0ABX4ZNE2_9PROT|nr:MULTISPECIES: FUSC family protein [Acetobacteraceae]MCL1562104.1 FUSC family protein [Parasaccharibacter sp. TMW 2.1886]MCQ0041594.1 FUSC family protein [Bombella sp.]MUG79116.1 FUSC family protein [Bombella sp. ESL0380]MUH02433.1 FUSC family protein [Bombella sp. ESL0387]QGT74822.1 FUSC family protein [Bombella sp. ESL0368]